MKESEGENESINNVQSMELQHRSFKKPPLNPSSGRLLGSNLSEKLSPSTTKCFPYLVLRAYVTFLDHLPLDLRGCIRKKLCIILENPCNTRPNGTSLGIVQLMLSYLPVLFFCAREVSPVQVGYFIKRQKYGFSYFIVFTRHESGQKILVFSAVFFYRDHPSISIIYRYFITGLRSNFFSQSIPSKEMRNTIKDNCFNN